MSSPRLMADEIEANLIRIIYTFDYPAPDTSGIVYLPSLDAFLVADSEVNEMDIFSGYNVFQVDLNSGIPIVEFSTIPFSSEPTGVTINFSNNHCFFSDDNRREIYEVDPGNDDTCLTTDDIVTSFATDTNFGSFDPEDVAYGLDSLFIVDGANNKVYRISSIDGVFKNVTGSNLLNSFDTKNLGVSDPEGIAFDSTNDSLFIVGHNEPSIIQTTIYGTLLNTIDISNLNALNPSGLALAPSSQDPSITNLYMVVRGVDNADDPYENDGAIYELGISGIITASNQAPVVTAGEDQAIILPNNALLSGSIYDDGLPDSTLTAIWAKQSGPGEVTFTDPNSLNTTVSFSTKGSYVLRLTGYDGEQYSADDLSIVVTSHIPEITLNGDNPMNLDLGEIFNDPWATAMDDADGDLTSYIQSTSNVDTSVVGIYQVTYTVIDSDGYSASL
ncbi:MAG: immunoglobulin-like domain-containing protein, partial [Psychromonas sp.]